MKKSRARSRQALRVYVPLFVISVVALMVMDRFVPIPVWLVVVILGMQVFTITGDLITLVWDRRSSDERGDGG
ncbi:MAG: hypothetical protein NTW19_04635 [Planctomycetota bacterium]|nr:hypothetical protein [Planctomycetota bacterium]